MKTGVSQHGAAAGQKREPRRAAGVAPFLRRPRVLGAAYGVALVLLILIGIYFRSRRYWLDPLGLWADEATWALRLFGRPLTELEFRPIGYMALTKLIVTVYSDERSLRFLSYAAGIGSLLISADLAKYLFESRLVRVLCVAVIACNPLLIDMAREFKPYALEFCVHLGLLWLFVRWRIQRTRGRLAGLLVCSALAFPFAYNVVFLLPEIFVLLGYACWRANRYRALLVVIGTAFVALSLIGAIYFCALRGTTQDGDGSAHFWGKKYDVFYLPKPNETHPLLSQAAWSARKYADLAALPGSHGNRPLTAKLPVTDATRKLGELGAGLWLGLNVVGLLAMLAWRRQWLLLLVGPLLMSLTFNVLHLWPFGAFRSNVFLLAYLVLIPMVGLDLLLSARIVFARLAGAISSACILIANCSACLEPHSRKHFFSTQTEMASLVRRMVEIRTEQASARQGHPTLVLLDMYTCNPFVFEVVHNDSAKRAFGSFLSEVDVQCAGSVSLGAKVLARYRGQAFFAVVSDDRRMPAFARLLERHAKIIDHEEVRGSQDLYFARAR